MNYCERCDRCGKLGYDKCHCRKKSKYGPKTKAHHGMRKYKALSITLPPELWKEIKKERVENESTSGLIRRLIYHGLAAIGE